MSSARLNFRHTLASLLSPRLLIGSIVPMLFPILIGITASWIPLRGSGLVPPVSAEAGTLDLKASTASYSGTMTQAGNQPIRTAFGPLRLDYKSGPNSWTTGFLIREGDGNVSIGANITSADFNSNSKLRVLGIVESTNGGFKFPDGTTQTTAASGNTSGWTDGGTNVYSTTATDNVAIGTTSPLAKLHVQGAAAVSGPGTISSSGPTVTGSSTTFTSTFQVGDAIIASGQTKNVSAIASDTSLTTSSNFFPVITAGTAYTSQVTIARLSDSNGTSQITVTAPGFIGIGTTSPAAQFDQLYDTTNIAGAAHRNTRIGRVTSSTLGVPIGLQNLVYHQIGAGLSVGQSEGFYNQNLRNYVQTNDLGTESSLYGIRNFYGHYNADASTPITTSVYGLRLAPYAKTGTITNMYDLYIDALSTGGTVTNRWALYQNDASTKNYFAGSVGIGITTPAAQLDLTYSSATLDALRFNDTNTNGRAWKIGSGTGGVGLFGIYDQTASAMRMVIDSSGNVGIGSTTPGAKLEVAGNINSSTGAIQTGSVTRIDNNGVGTFAAGTTIGGSAVTAAVVDKTLASGRLTLTSGTPVTTSDVTAATTVYYTPYDGDVISLYDGSSTWTTLTFSELSLALTSYTANTNYGIWAYNNSGTVALESTAWTNDTTRATALVYQNGVLSKTGATTRRLLGTIRITGTTGQTEDSTSKRFVWNYRNRDKRDLKALINVGSFTNTSGSFVSANGNTTPGAGRVDFVIGWQDARVEFYWGVAVDNTAINWTIVGLDLDGTSANDALQTIAAAQDGTTRATSSVKYESKPPVGYHFLQKVIRNNGANTSNVFPNNVVSSYATGYIEG